MAVYKGNGNVGSSSGGNSIDFQELYKQVAAKNGSSTDLSSLSGKVSGERSKTAGRDNSNSIVGRDDWEESGSPRREATGLESFVNKVGNIGNTIMTSGPFSKTVQDKTDPETGESSASFAIKAGAAIESIVPSYIGAPLEGVSEGYAAATGKPVFDVEDGQIADYNMTVSEKAGAGLNAAINTVGPFVGGTGTLAKGGARALARGVGGAEAVQKLDRLSLTSNHGILATAAEEAGHGKAAQRAAHIASDVFEEGSEEFIQSYAEDAQYSNIDEGSLGRAVEAFGYGALAGGAASAGGVGLNAIAEHGATKDQNLTAGVTGQNTQQVPGENLRMFGSRTFERAKEIADKQKTENNKIPGSGSGVIAPTDMVDWGLGLNDMSMGTDTFVGAWENNDDKGRQMWANMLIPDSSIPIEDRVETINNIVNMRFTSTIQNMCDALNDLVDKANEIRLDVGKNPNASYSAYFTTFLKRFHTGYGVKFNPMVTSYGGQDVDGDMKQIFLDALSKGWHALQPSDGSNVGPGKGYGLPTKFLTDWFTGSSAVNFDYFPNLQFSNKTEIHDVLMLVPGMTHPMAWKFANTMIKGDQTVDTETANYDQLVAEVTGKNKGKKSYSANVQKAFQGLQEQLNHTKMEQSERDRILSEAFSRIGTAATTTNKFMGVFIEENDTPELIAQKAANTEAEPAERDAKGNLSPDQRMSQGTAHKIGNSTAAQAAMQGKAVSQADVDAFAGAPFRTIGAVTMQTIKDSDVFSTSGRTISSVTLMNLYQMSVREQTRELENNATAMFNGRVLNRFFEGIESVKRGTGDTIISAETAFKCFAEAYREEARFFNKAISSIDSYKFRYGSTNVGSKRKNEGDLSEEKIAELIVDTIGDDLRVQDFFGFIDVTNRDYNRTLTDVLDELARRGTESWNWQQLSIPESDQRFVNLLSKAAQEKMRRTNDVVKKTIENNDSISRHGFETKDIKVENWGIIDAKMDSLCDILPESVIIEYNLGDTEGFLTSPVGLKLLAKTGTALSDYIQAISIQARYAAVHETAEVIREEQAKENPDKDKLMALKEKIVLDLNRIDNGSYLHQVIANDIARSLESDGELSTRALDLMADDSTSAREKEEMINAQIRKNPEFARSEYRTILLDSMSTADTTLAVSQLNELTMRAKNKVTKGELTSRDAMRLEAEAFTAIIDDLSSSGKKYAMDAITATVLDHAYAVNADILCAEAADAFTQVPKEKEKALKTDSQASFVNLVQIITRGGNYSPMVDAAELDMGCMTSQTLLQNKLLTVSVLFDGLTIDTLIDSQGVIHNDFDVRDFMREVLGPNRESDLDASLEKGTDGRYYLTLDGLKNLVKECPEIMSYLPPTKITAKGGPIGPSQTSTQDPSSFAKEAVVFYRENFGDSQKRAQRSKVLARAVRDPRFMSFWIACTDFKSDNYYERYSALEKSLDDVIDFIYGLTALCKNGNVDIQSVLNKDFDMAMLEDLNGVFTKAFDLSAAIYNLSDFQVGEYRKKIEDYIFDPVMSSLVLKNLEKEALDKIASSLDLGKRMSKILSSAAAGEAAAGVARAGKSTSGEDFADGINKVIDDLVGQIQEQANSEALGHMYTTLSEDISLAMMSLVGKDVFIKAFKANVTDILFTRMTDELDTPVAESVLSNNREYQDLLNDFAEEVYRKYQLDTQSNTANGGKLLDAEDFEIEGEVLRKIDVLVKTYPSADVLAQLGDLRIKGVALEQDLRSLDDNATEAERKKINDAINTFVMRVNNVMFSYTLLNAMADVNGDVNPKGLIDHYHNIQFLEDFIACSDGKDFTASRDTVDDLKRKIGSYTVFNPVKSFAGVYARYGATAGGIEMGVSIAGGDFLNNSMGFAMLPKNGDNISCSAPPRPLDPNEPLEHDVLVVQDAKKYDVYLSDIRNYDEYLDKYGVDDGSGQKVLMVYHPDDCTCGFCHKHSGKPFNKENNHSDLREAIARISFWMQEDNQLKAAKAAGSTTEIARPIDSGDFRSTKQVDPLLGYDKIHVEYVNYKHEVASKLCENFGKFGHGVEDIIRKTLKTPGKDSRPDYDHMANLCTSCLQYEDADGWHTVGASVLESEDKFNEWMSEHQVTSIKFQYLSPYVINDRIEKAIVREIRSGKIEGYNWETQDSKRRSTDEMTLKQLTVAQNVAWNAIRNWDDASVAQEGGSTELRNELRRMRPLRDSTFQDIHPANAQTDVFSYNINRSSVNPNPQTAWRGSRPLKAIADRDKASSIKEIRYNKKNSKGSLRVDDRKCYVTDYISLDGSSISDKDKLIGGRIDDKAAAIIVDGKDINDIVDCLKGRNEDYRDRIFSYDAVLVPNNPQLPDKYKGMNVGLVEVPTNDIERGKVEFVTIPVSNLRNEYLQGVSPYKASMVLFDREKDLFVHVADETGAIVGNDSAVLATSAAIEGMKQPYSDSFRWVPELQEVKTQGALKILSRDEIKALADANPEFWDQLIRGPQYSRKNTVQKFKNRLEKFRNDFESGSLSYDGHPADVNSDDIICIVQAKSMSGDPVYIPLFNGLSSPDGMQISDVRLSGSRCIEVSLGGEWVPDDTLDSIAVKGSSPNTADKHMIGRLSDEYDALIMDGNDNFCGGRVFFHDANSIRGRMDGIWNSFHNIGLFNCSYEHNSSLRAEFVDGRWKVRSNINDILLGVPDGETNTILDIMFNPNHPGSLEYWKKISSGEIKFFVSESNKPFNKRYIALNETIRNIALACLSADAHPATIFETRWFANIDPKNVEAIASADKNYYNDHPQTCTDKNVRIAEQDAVYVLRNVGMDKLHDLYHVMNEFNCPWFGEKADPSIHRMDNAGRIAMRYKDGNKTGVRYFFGWIGKEDIWGKKSGGQQSTPGSAAIGLQTITRDGLTRGMSPAFAPKLLRQIMINQDVTSALVRNNREITDISGYSSDEQAYREAMFNLQSDAINFDNMLGAFFTSGDTEAYIQIVDRQGTDVYGPAGPKRLMLFDKEYNQGDPFRRDQLSGFHKYKEVKDALNRAFGMDSTELTDAFCMMIFATQYGWTHNDNVGQHAIPFEHFQKVMFDIVKNLDAGLYPFSGGVILDGRRVAMGCLPKQLAYELWSNSPKLQQMYPDFDQFVEAGRNQLENATNAIQEVRYGINSSYRAAKQGNKARAFYYLRDYIGSTYGDSASSNVISYLMSPEDMKTRLDVALKFEHWNDEEREFLEELDRRFEQQSKVLHERARIYAERRQKRLPLTGIRGEDGSIIPGLTGTQVYTSVVKNAGALARTMAVSTPGVLSGSVLDGSIRSWMMVQGNKIPVGQAKHARAVMDSGVSHAASKNRQAQKLYNALESAQRNGFIDEYISDYSTAVDKDEFFNQKYAGRGKFERVTDKVMDTATGGRLFGPTRLELFLDDFVGRCYAHNAVEFIAPGPTGQPRIVEILSQPDGAEQLILTVARTDHPSHGDFLASVNYSQRQAISHENLASLLMKNMFQKHPTLDLVNTMFGTQFYRYSSNIFGRTLNHFMPLSSVHYLLVEKLKTTDFGILNEVEQVQAHHDLRCALLHDAMSMTAPVLASVLANLVLSGIKALQLPEDEDDMTDFRNWLLCGIPLNTEWWVQDTIGIALPMACFVQTCMNGTPRLDVLFNGLTICMGSNPALKVGDVASVLLDPEGLLYDWEDMASDYENTNEGAPDAARILEVNANVAMWTALTKFITPAVFKELYSGYNVERSYKRVWADGVEGVDPDNYEVGDTQRVDFDEAMLRRASRRNPTMGFILDLLNPDERTSYMATGNPLLSDKEEMPGTVYYDQIQYAFNEKYNIMEEDPISGEWVEKSDDEKLQIALDIITTLESYDDMQELREQGFAINGQTRYYVGTVIRQMIDDKNSTFYDLINSDEYDVYVLGDGDYQTGQQIRSAMWDEHNAEIDYLESLYYDKLNSEEVKAGVQTYLSVNTDYRLNNRGEYVASGFNTREFSVSPLNLFALPLSQTMGAEGSFETPSAVVAGESTGRRGLVPVDADQNETLNLYTEVEPLNGETSTNTSNGSGTDSDDDDDNDSSSSGYPYSSKKYSSGGYSRSRRSSGGGGSSSKTIYSRPGNLNIDGPYTMNTSRLYGANFDYLRPAYETKGSREAYKRGDF